MGYKNKSTLIYHTENILITTFVSAVELDLDSSRHLDLDKSTEICFNVKN